MDSSSIKTLDELKEFLYRAMQLEHATIPPYLTALYSIKPG
ncbi:ferritin-like domain-containing protein, partial [Rhizobium ruizarguesonis]